VFWKKIARVAYDIAEAIISPVEHFCWRRWARFYTLCHYPSARLLIKTVSHIDQLPYWYARALYTYEPKRYSGQPMSKQRTQRALQTWLRYKAMDKFNQASRPKKSN
jgi:hypothetical protein